MRLKGAIKKRLAWSELKSVLLIFLSITVIISIFDYDNDSQIWLLEILRNFCLSVCIATSFLIYSIIIDVISIKNRWLNYLLKVLLWFFSGISGALFGWFINDLLFGFSVSHVFLFFAVIASISFVISIILTGRDVMSDQIRIMADRISKNEIKEQKLLKMQADAKLDALRSKVNPHFFFNTLNTIAELIPKDPEKAEHLLEQFSTLFRYPFTEEKNKFVPLKKEIDFINDYLDIEKNRMGDRLSFEINCEEAAEELLVPVMIIQPLIENSIIHGISKKKEGGHISLHCRAEERFCIIEISDNGKGFNTEVYVKGFGIKGVEERLSLLFDKDFTFTVKSENGVNVLIKFPEKLDL